MTLKALGLPVLGMALALGMTAGCVARAPVVYGTVEVENAPPPAQVEVRTTVPYEGAQWIEGHWEWHGRWVWHAGYWERARHGWVWVPHHYVQAGKHWRYVPGHWRRV
jgi:hypothetical protein